MQTFSLDEVAVCRDGGVGAVGLMGGGVRQDGRGARRGVSSEKFESGGLGRALSADQSAEKHRGRCGMRAARSAA